MKLIPTGVQEMARMPKGIRMELLSIIFFDKSDVYKEIEEAFKKVAIGLFRENYQVFERRNLAGVPGGLPVAGFLLVSVNSDNNPEQEESLDRTVYLFCVDQRKKGKGLVVCYGSDNLTRRLLIMTLTDLSSFENVSSFSYMG